MSRIRKINTPPVGSIMIRKRPHREKVKYVSDMGVTQNCHYHMFQGFCIDETVMPYYFEVEDGDYVVVEDGNESL